MIYLATFGLSCLFFQISEKMEKPEKKIFSYTLSKPKQSFMYYACIAAALLIPSLLAGLRDSSIGTDVGVYGDYWLEYAEKYQHNFFAYIKMASEQSIGLIYALLNYISAFLTDDKKVFYFLLSFIETLMVYLGVRGFKDKISVPFAMFCYYTIFYNNTLNLLRQSLAVAFVCFSYQFLVKNKYKAFWIVTVLAVLSHNSAVIALILFFVWEYLKRCDTKASVYVSNVALFFVISFIMVAYKPFLQFFVEQHILPERFLLYIQSTDVTGGRLIRIGFWILIGIFAYVAFYKMINYDSRNKFLMTCVTMSAAFSLILFMGNVYAIRVAYYFDGTAIIFIPMIPKVYKIKVDNAGNMRYLVYLILAVILVVRWYLEYVRSLNGQTYPYHFAKF